MERESRSMARMDARFRRACRRVSSATAASAAIPPKHSAVPTFPS
jgi:hypothetical protein